MNVVCIVNGQMEEALTYLELLSRHLPVRTEESREIILDETEVRKVQPNSCCRNTSFSWERNSPSLMKLRGLLRHCAASRKDAGSVSEGVIGIFD
jgi:hypothetical protein